MNKDELIKEFVSWVELERANLRKYAHPLASDAKDFLSGYLSPSTLSEIRFLSVNEIPNPPFYNIDYYSHMASIINFNTFDGLTFQDTFLITPRANESVVIKECIHVAQYKKLSVNGYMENYFSSFNTENNTIDYINNKLESEARYVTSRILNRENFSFER